MSKKKKSNGKVSIQPLSPKNIIIQRGRTYPIVECWINKNWQDIGEASIAIVRKMGGDKFAIGMYLLDLYCLGLKDGFYHVEPTHVKEEILQQVHKNMDMIACDATLAQNIIYGAIEYAEDLGFKPAKEFAVLQYLLDDVEEIEYMEVEFGFKGKPMYIPSPHENVGLILSTLNKSVGEGNYIFQENEDLPDELTDLEEEELEIWKEMSQEERISYLVDYKIATFLDEKNVSYKASEEEIENVSKDFVQTHKSSPKSGLSDLEVFNAIQERVKQFLRIKRDSLEEGEDNIKEDEFNYTYVDIAIDMNFYVKRFSNLSPDTIEKFNEMTGEERDAFIENLMIEAEGTQDSEEYTAFEEVKED